MRGSRRGTQRCSVALLLQRWRCCCKVALLLQRGIAVATRHWCRHAAVLLQRALTLQRGACQGPTGGRFRHQAAACMHHKHAIRRMHARTHASLPHLPICLATWLSYCHICAGTKIGLPQLHHATRQAHLHGDQLPLQLIGVLERTLKLRVLNVALGRARRNPNPHEIGCGMAYWAVFGGVLRACGALTDHCSDAQDGDPADERPHPGV